MESGVLKWPWHVQAVMKQHHSLRRYSNSELTMSLQLEWFSCSWLAELPHPKAAHVLEISIFISFSSDLCHLETWKSILFKITQLRMYLWWSIKERSNTEWFYVNPSDRCLAFIFHRLAYGIEINHRKLKLNPKTYQVTYLIKATACFSEPV